VRHDPGRATARYGNLPVTPVAALVSDPKVVVTACVPVVKAPVPEAVLAELETAGVDDVG